MSSDRAARRARRLARAYPAKWRARYGDEFVELLADELRERPRSCAVIVDVVRGAAVARLREAGIGDQPLVPSEQLTASMATLVWSLAAGFVVGVAMWSQVVVGWRWEPPSSHAVAAAMLLMSGAIAALGVLAVLATLPVMWTGLRSVRNDRRRALTAPAGLTAISTIVLFIGGRHFAGGWPGTGGHDWGHHALVPAGLASFGWAATRGITSYWAHPGALASFPLSEVLWMVLSPLALAGLIVGTTRIVRRIDLPPRVLRFEIGLAVLAAIAMGVLCLGAGVWVLDNGTPGPTGIYRVGAIDALGVATMVAGCAVAARATVRARAAIRSTV